MTIHKYLTYNTYTVQNNYTCQQLYTNECWIISCTSIFWTDHNLLHSKSKMSADQMYTSALKITLVLEYSQWFLIQTECQIVISVVSETIPLIQMDTVHHNLILNTIIIILMGCTYNRTQSILSI